MRLVFRPLPGFTVFMAALIALLTALGIWQMQRLHWKLGLIAEAKARLHAAPVSLAAALKLGEGAQYRRVVLTGHFLNADESYVYATGPQGVPVYHVLVPFADNDSATVMVDRGIVPVKRIAPAEHSQPLGERRVLGVLRTPDAPGLFTPAPDLAHRIWYARDVSAIAAALRVTLAAPVLIEADGAPNPGGFPLGGQTVVTFRNEHLQYAITWFSLAYALLILYFLYHRSRGRLRLEK